jgi:YaiO family outer membrane protein
MLALDVPIACQAAPPQALGRDAAYAKAVKSRLAGDNAGAIAQLQVLLAADPNDVDARLQLGFALRAMGRSADAEREFTEVLRRAPDYKDARVALAQLQWARGDVAAAKATLGPELIRNPGDAETSAFVAKLIDNKPPQLWRVDVNGAVSDLTEGLAQWNEVDLAVSRKVDANSALTASVQTIERFDIHETYLEGAYDHGWNGGEISIAVGGSLNPTFRPIVAVHSEALLNPWQGAPWTVAISGAFSRYVVGDVETVSAGADRLILGDSGKLGARFIVTHDETGAYLYGFSTDAGWRFTPKFDATATYVDSAETDTGRTVRVRAYGVAANLNLTDSAILHASVTEEARENSFDRLEFALGATAKF